MRSSNNKNHQKYKNNRTLKFIIGLVLLIVVACSVWYGFSQHKTVTPLPKNVDTSTSPSDNNINNQRKASTSPAPTLNNGATTSPSNNISSISVTVTRASVVDNSLQVGTLVNGTTSGSCVLDVAQAGQTPITQTNQVTIQNNSYVCPVFSIPLSDFPNQSDWNVSVGVTNDGTTASSNWINNPVSLTPGT